MICISLIIQYYTNKPFLAYPGTSAATKKLIKKVKNICELVKIVIQNVSGDLERAPMVHLLLVACELTFRYTV